MKDTFQKLSTGLPYYPQIPLILVGKDGEVSEYPSPFLDITDRIKEQWAWDTIGSMQNRLSNIRQICPELLYSYARQGGQLAITEGQVYSFHEHVLGKNGKEDVLGKKTLGLSFCYKNQEGKQRIVTIIDNHAVWYQENGAPPPQNGKTYKLRIGCTLTHEMAHAADLNDLARRGTMDTNSQVRLEYGRHTKSTLFRALAHLENETNPNSATRTLVKDIQNYPTEDQIYELLPLMMERYVEKRQLSTLERLYIENVLRPDMRLRANSDPIKTYKPWQHTFGALTMKLPKEVRDALDAPVRPETAPKMEKSIIIRNEALIREALYGVMQTAPERIAHKKETYESTLAASKNRGTSPAKNLSLS